MTRTDPEIDNTAKAAKALSDDSLTARRRQRTVTWVEVEEPWLLEAHSIRTFALPLNIGAKSGHAFCPELRALRKQSRHPMDRATRSRSLMDHIAG